MAVFTSEGETTMTTLRKSLLALGAAMAIAGLLALPAPAMAQAANPCAPKAQATGQPSVKAGNPCAAKPAAPKTANPCARKK
jgi:hypothetical protein